jgi:Domain of unknown function (DUF1830)
MRRQTQIESLSTERPNHHFEFDMILCHYTNTSRHIQIARIQNIDGWFLERVIIPGGSLIFEAPAVAQLEIYCSKTVTSTLSDRIRCEQLQVREESEHRQGSSDKNPPPISTGLNLLRRRYSA